MFWLALRTGVLTVLTLGFYRFWAKTRLRRYYWSAIRPGGTPLEYVGDPLEKLLGFLVAVVFMAFYIGVVNLLLMYFSFALLKGNAAAYVLSFIGLAPIIFFAQYRARRYILARTRWRGIRFGLEPGAWGYSWRAMVHWGVAILSLGLLWPLTTLWLEKYRASRTYFGSERFTQSGRRGLLFGAMKHVYYPLILSLVAGGMAAAFDNPAWAAFGFLTLPWFIYGLAYWKAESFKRMTEAKRLGAIGFETAPRPWRIMGIYALGGMLINLVLSGFVLFAVMLITLAAGVSDFENADLSDFTELGILLGPGIALLYFGVFLAYRAMVHAWITLPLAAHFAQVTRLIDAQGLMDITQRDRDAFAEAEGFADALDVGAAI